MNDDLYRKLREWMDSVTPMGMRETETGAELELLESLFSPDGAEIALHLTTDLQPLEAVAHLCGRDIRNVEVVLDKLYLDGLIRRHTDEAGRKGYASLAFVPGLMENVLFLRRSDKKLHSLIYRVFKDNRRNSFNVQTGMTRTVPVAQTIEAPSSTAPYQDIVELVRKAPEPIMVFPCHCKIYKADRCNAPMEVCLAFGDHASFYMDTGVAGRRIDVEEALSILRIAEDAGLVHQFVNYTNDDLSWLCNCCACCCINMSASVKFYPDGKVRNIDPSAYIATIDPGICVGCGLCVERCHVHALEMKEDVCIVKEERCIGCGQCVGACAVDAIRLAGREAQSIPQPPRDWRELIERQHKERLSKS